MKHTCVVCEGTTTELFRKQVLGRHDVGYHRCERCGLVQTDPPHWLDEAYADAISALDTGLVARALTLAPKVERIARAAAKLEGRFLDYGGGSGLFVRMMRDRGLRFFREDPFAEPVFSRHFDLADLPVTERHFEFATAFEVLEHLPRPIEVVSSVLRMTSTLVFTTDLVPTREVQVLADWWYLGAAHGQHVCFYGTDSLNALAARVGAQYVQLEPSLHVLTRDQTFSQRVKSDPDTRTLEPLTWSDSLHAAGRRQQPAAPSGLIHRVRRGLKNRLARVLR